jgi:hypothetical protein
VTICDKAPIGWKCTRALGHDGPCAAYADTVRPGPLPGAPYRGNWTNEQSAARLASLCVADRPAAISAALDLAERRGMSCPGDGVCFTRRGTHPCREHGCRVCGAPILADTEDWPAPLCIAHAPETLLDLVGALLLPAPGVPS